MAAPAFAQTAPAVIDLATLDGSNGFAIAGPATVAALGTAVSGAGDVNHDGLADIIVAAPAAKGEGTSYVIFGNPVLGGGGTFDLAALDGSNGFEFQSRSRPEEGATIYTDFGVAVADVGDVNADGIDDVAAAALTSDTGDGATWVAFGNDEVFPALVLSWELEGIDGTDGFVSRPGFLNLVRSVSGAGDVNGDGVDDLIVGTPQRQSEFVTGEAYVLFGKPDIAATANGRPLTGTNGFSIPGLAEREQTGVAVGGGDVNADGRSDVVVAAPRAPGGESDAAGQTYVIFGASAIGMSGSFDVATLDGTNGFVLHGAQVTSVAVGDVNGDDFADVVLGEPEVDFNGVVFSGAVYVVFGSNNAFPATLDLASLDGSNGYVIAGASANDFAGTSVDVASDVNGDDVDDIVIGAPQHFPSEEEQPGVAYVVFGGAGVGGSGVVELAALDGTNGFALEGAAARDRAGESVSGAGDVNGDGLGDIIVGAPGADSSNGLSSGTSYVVFGRAAATPATCRVTATPNVLWPPNRQLIGIQTTVTVQDDANIPFSYELVAVTSNEPNPNSIVGWELGTADTNGLLRAQRNAGGDGRVYTLAYRVFGTLGTIASCEASVRVPHDMRPPRDDRPTGPIRPSLPRLPDLPSLPGRPDLPRLPTLPNLPNLPDLPDLPDVPDR